MDLAAFQAGLKAFAEQVPVVVKEKQAALLARVTSDVADGTPDETPPTPYRTGNARSNWFPAVGAPSQEYEELGVVQGEGEGARRLIDFSIGRDAAAIQSIERVPEAAAEITPYCIAYVTNNAPYIRRLEYEGHSKQAPDGFARIAVAKIISDETR